MNTKDALNTQHGHRCSANFEAPANPRRRPAVHKAQSSQTVLESQPEAFLLDEAIFFFNKIAGGEEKGAVAGLSGMTADHLQPVLDSARDTLLLFQFAAALARGLAPPCQWKELEGQDHRVAEAPWR